MDWHRLFGLLLTDYFTGTPFEVELENCEDLKNVTCGIALHNERSQRIVFFHTLYHSGFTFAGSKTANSDMAGPRRR